mmetsp:Transcript_9523/g.28393  ORF Transcript_9523/g.28393 Transcript_9523/m.28393 type:complete len:288 (+) Transcript_9523:168-1031(+)
MIHISLNGFAVVVVLFATILISRKLSTSEAYSPVPLTFPSTIGSKWSSDRQSARLFLQKGWFYEGDEEDEDSLVTREDLNRDLLGMEPKVKRRKKNGKGQGYTPLDNRDHLPFSVRTKTPDDPYKTEFQRRKEQQTQNKNNMSKRNRTDLDRHMLASTRRGSAANNEKKNKGKKNNSDVSTTPSRLIQKKSQKNDRSRDGKCMTTILGEFQLDKSTTSGDIIVVGDKEYLVETARCQYKYAGGQRFVMVRKILEVKEVTRVKKEDDLRRQYNSSPSSLLSTTSNEYE